MTINKSIAVIPACEARFFNLAFLYRIRQAKEGSNNLFLKCQSISSPVVGTSAT